MSTSRRSFCLSHDSRSPSLIPLHYMFPLLVRYENENNVNDTGYPLSRLLASHLYARNEKSYGFRQTRGNANYEILT